MPGRVRRPALLPQALRRRAAFVGRCRAAPGRADCGPNSPRAVAGGGTRVERVGTPCREESPMPVATPEIYAQMLDTAKEKSFAFPAINVSSSQTLNAALKGFADAESRRDHPDLDRWRGIPLRAVRQEHGDRLGRLRGVRRRGRQELPGPRRPPHRPLPEGQARRLRPAADRHQRRAGRPGRGAALPVPYVGRVRRTARGEPRDRPGNARRVRGRAHHPRGRDRRRGRRGGRRRGASSSTRSSTPRPRTRSTPWRRSASATRAAT